MATENGFGTALEMVVDEETPENNFEHSKEENVEKSVSEENKEKETKNYVEEKNNSQNVEEHTSVVMEVDEVQEIDPLANNDVEDKIITPRPRITETADNVNNNANTQLAVTEFVSSGNTLVAPVDVDNKRTRNSIQIKEEINEIVLIDSEDEKDEKPKVQVVANLDVQHKQNKTVTINNNINRSLTSKSNNNKDFQIVSVDDDSPMNKNDPMNVFLCSTEERDFRKEYFKDPSSNVLKQRLHCTICDIHIGACPQNSKNMVCHKALKVLVCRKCANFYGQGEFPQEDGSDEFCRWCGEGGEVFLCNSCSNVFCQACILRNFGMAEVKRVDKLENWDCYVCDTRPLWTLRAIAFALFTYVRRIKVVAYRSGMYQTLNSANAKVSKSDLMALETDLSTCCPKEVKAAAVAASAPSPPPQPPPLKEKLPPLAIENKGVKPKENKANHRSALAKVPLQVPNNVYAQQQPQPPSRAPASKRSKQQQPAQPAAPAPPWTQPQSQLLPEYYAAPGKRLPVPPQPTFALTQPPIMYPSPQSSLRTALMGQQPNFLPSQPIVTNSFGPQNHMILYSQTASPTMANSKDDSQPVLKWFNGVLISLMETIKNIDNRLVFIRNSTSNLISQNEVSVLVSQLHSLLKVSCSRLQEVDCDLLKNYKEFIDKSEITVNDFDEIVREFPEFFKPTESIETPENIETDPEPTDEFNPMSLVEVVEDRDQPSHSQSSCSPKTDSNKQSTNTSCSSVSEKNLAPTKMNPTPSSQPETTATATTLSSKTLTASNISSLMIPCSVTIKKEILSVDDKSGNLANVKNGKKSVNEGVKRKSDFNEDQGKNKIKVAESVCIKKEVTDDEEQVSDIQKNLRIRECRVKLNSVNKAKTSLSS